MRVVIELEASEAAAAVHALVDTGARAGGRVGKAAEGLAGLVEREAARLRDVSVLLRRFGDSLSIDVDVERAYSDDGDELKAAAEGSIDFEVEDFLGSRRLGVRRIDRCLDVLASLRGLELTRVVVQLDGAPSSIDGLASVLVAYADARGTALPPLAARVVAEGLEEGEIDEDDEDWDDDLDEDEDEDDLDADENEDDDDLEDDEEENVEDVARAAPAPRPGLGPLSADEHAFLVAAGLSWPCRAVDVRLRRPGVLLAVEPDLFSRADPARASASEENYARLRRGAEQLHERCRLLGRP